MANEIWRVFSRPFSLLPLNSLVPSSWYRPDTREHLRRERKEKKEEEEEERREEEERGARRRRRGGGEANISIESAGEEARTYDRSVLLDQLRL